MGSSHSGEFVHKVQELVKSGEVSVDTWQELLEHPMAPQIPFDALTHEFVQELPQKHKLLSFLDVLINILGQFFQQSSQVLLNSIQLLSKLLILIQESQELKSSLWVDRFPIKIVNTLMRILFDEVPGVWSQYLADDLNGEPLQIRTYVVLCILHSLIPAVHISFEASKVYTDPWLWLYAAHPHAKTLLVSLFNVVCISQEYQGISSGIDEFSGLCAQLLALVLSFKQSEVRDEAELARHWIIETWGDTAVDTTFVQILQESTEEADFKDFSQNLAVMLSYWREQPGYFLSKSEVKYDQEVLVVFWYFSEANPRYSEYLAQSASAQDILESFLGILLGGLTQPTRLSNLQLVYFILLQLSKNHTICTLFAHPPNSVLFTGHSTLFDVLIVASFKLLTKSLRLEAFFHLILSVIANISPIATVLGRTGSYKLYELFEFYTSPRSQEGPKMLPLLLEIISNRLQYQYAGSLELLYIFASNPVPWHKFLAQELTPALDLSVLSLVFSELVPQVEHQFEANPSVEEQEILDYLSLTTMVGKFPRPPELINHSFQSTLNTSAWLNAFTWGMIFTNRVVHSYTAVDKVNLFTLALINNNA